MDINAVIESAKSQARLKAGETFSQAQEKFNKGKELLDATKEVIEGSVGGIALGEGMRKGTENIKKIGAGARRLARASVKLNKRLGIGTKQGTLREDGGKPAEAVDEGEDLAPEPEDLGTEMTSGNWYSGEGASAVKEATVMGEDQARSLSRVARDVGTRGDIRELVEGGREYTNPLNTLGVEDRGAKTGYEAIRDNERGSAGGDSVADEGADVGAEAGAEVGETAEITGETGLSAGLETFGVGAEALGDTEIASVVGIPLGIATDVLGGAGLIAGIITGGVGIGKEINAHMGHAQDSLNASQNNIQSLAGRVASRVSNHADLSRMR